MIKLQSFGDADITGEELHDILKEIDTNMNGQVELDEYLQVSDIEIRKNLNKKVVNNSLELRMCGHQTSVPRSSGVSFSGVP